MKCIRILGVCLLAVFALAAVAATSASASLPAVFECHKVTVKGSGIWNKGCKVEGKHNKELKENEWEIQEWNLAAKKGKVKPFKGAGKGSFLEDKDLEGTIKCTKFKDSGQFTGPKTVGKVKVEFFGCTKLGKVCTSVGAPTGGEIVPNVLSGEIGYITKEGEVTLPPHTVGLDLHPKKKQSCTPKKSRPTRSSSNATREPSSSGSRARSSAASRRRNSTNSRKQRRSHTNRRKARRRSSVSKADSKTPSVLKSSPKSRSPRNPAAPKRNSSPNSKPRKNTKNRYAAPASPTAASRPKPPTKAKNSSCRPES